MEPGEAVVSSLTTTNDQKLKDHPMSLEKDWENKTIPLFIHGDGVDYANNDNLLVFSWGCLASNLPTLLNLACFPKSCGTKKTWEVPWKHLHWSFEALACGRNFLAEEHHDHHHHHHHHHSQPAP